MRFIVFSLCVFMTGCGIDFDSNVSSRSDHTTEFSGEAMTMRYSIIVGHHLSSEQIKSIKQLISSVFDEVNRIHNKWNPNSELSQLNNLQANVKVPLSPQLELLMKKTQTIVELSEGRFDPTIEPLQQLWKSKLQNEQIPSETELEAIRPMIGWNKIHFEGGLFSKDHPSIKLDLGGIAKGFAIDTMVERLQEQGYSNVFVEWGGEIRASGEHPDQRPWKIYISRLGDNQPDHAIDTLPLVNQAIATSGDYLQNWSIRAINDQKKATTVTYFHIFDPKTLHPLKASHTSIASVSVVANDCTFADGLATSAMMFPDCAAAQEWAERVKELYPELSFWIISRSQ